MGTYFLTFTVDLTYKRFLSLTDVFNVYEFLKALRADCLIMFVA